MADKMAGTNVIYVAKIYYDESMKKHTAELPDFLGVRGYGSTIDQAVENMVKVFKSGLRSLVTITKYGPRPKPEFMAGVEQLDATKYRRVTIDITDLLPK
ncbi:MAG TPA: hypothetical protein VJK72_04515 [Candidatus Nanoarchaeia archaeon]|nr:hypothetical protein [Candidatus Nanoarchaeia archaeon]